MSTPHNLIHSSPSRDESDNTLRRRTVDHSSRNSYCINDVDNSHYRDYIQRSSDRTTLRRKTMKQLKDPSYFQRVRRASKLVAEKAWRSRLEESGGEIPSSAAILGREEPSSVYFDALLSESSLHSYDEPRLSSTERAALRGTKRALRESEDVVGGDVPFNGVGSTSEFDLDTIDESAKGEPKPPGSFLRMRSLLRGGPGRRVVRFATRSSPSNRGTVPSTDGASKRSEEETSSAWMCGVCGMVFATEVKADEHEQNHIAEVVAGMEWMPKQKESSSRVEPFLYHRPVAASKNGFSSSILLRSDAGTMEMENIPLTPKSRSDHASSPSSAHAVGNATPIIDTVRFRLDYEEENRGETMPSSKLVDDGYPGLEADLPHTDFPRQRARANLNNEVRFAQDSSLDHETHSLLLRNDDRIVLADEALCDVVLRAVPMILTHRECDAELELALLARDKAYYDELAKRSVARRVNPSNRFRSDGEDALAKMQNKFLDAYQLMKESDGTKGVTDQYNRIKKVGEESLKTITQSDHTLYVNVMVKNSVKVVRHELERLAKQRWDVATAEEENLTRFERFRVYTQTHVVKLAGLALASDFTVRPL